MVLRGGDGVPFPTPTRGQAIEVLFAGPLTAANAVRVIALSLGNDDVWLDDHAIDFVLWEQTAFPMCGIEHALRQVHDCLQPDTMSTARLDQAKGTR